jgi:hypothetical protein
MEAIIKPNDLRYGNKLLFLGEEVTFEYITNVRDENVFWIKLKENRIEHKSFHFKPIPLTEEWLLRFGGKENGFEWQFKIGEFTVCFEKRNDKFYYTGGEGVQMSRNIEFVHDFQNLVYALEGIELTTQELNQ